MLLVRDQLDGPAETLPRARWRFARQAGDRIVVRGGESLRGKEKLEVVGVFEHEVRSATKETPRKGA